MDDCTVCGYKTIAEVTGELNGTFQDPLPPNTRLKFVRTSLPMLWCDSDGGMVTFLNDQYMFVLDSESRLFCGCECCHLPNCVIFTNNQMHSLD